ncbi:hypothetical protein ARZXY2_4926 (plasmid) [Arthrobacter sp. ZXY-2]|nr:hypothetical protein ARZXY2_4926 [Arthrobacter sp. ZXY-2]
MASPLVPKILVHIPWTKAIEARPAGVARSCFSYSDTSQVTSDLDTTGGAIHWGIFFSGR